MFLFLFVITFLIISSVGCTNQFNINSSIISNQIKNSSSLLTFHTENYMYQSPIIVDEYNKKISISENNLIVPDGKTYTLLHGSLNHVSGPGNLTVKGDAIVNSVSIEGTLHLIHGKIGTIQANSVLLGGMVSHEFAYGPTVAGMIDAEDSVRIWNDSTIQSIQCNGDISISSGTVIGNINAEKTITIGSNELDYFDANANPVPIHIQGNVTAAKQITISPIASRGRNTTIDGIVTADKIYLSGNGNAKISGISPYSADAVLILDNFNSTLPEISGFHEVILSKGFFDVQKLMTSSLMINSNTKLFADNLQITKLLLAEASSQIATPAGAMYIADISGQTSWMSTTSIQEGTTLWITENTVQAKISTPGIVTYLEQNKNQTEIKAKDIKWAGIKIPEIVQIEPNQPQSVPIENIPLGTTLPQGYDLHLETYLQDEDERIKSSHCSFTATQIDAGINLVAEDWNPNDETNRKWISCYITDQHGKIVPNSQVWTEIQIMSPASPPGNWDLDTHEISLISGKENYQFLIKNSWEPEQIEIKTTSNEHLSVSLIDKQDPQGTRYQITTKVTDIYCSEYIKVIYQGKISILKVNLYPSDGSITLKHKEYMMSPGESYKIDIMIHDSQGNQLSVEQMKELIVNHQLFVENSHAGNVVDLQQLPDGNYQIIAKQVGSCNIIYQLNGRYDSVQIPLTIHVKPNIHQYGSQESYTAYLKYKNFL